MPKLGPQSKESANFFNKSLVIDGTMIVEEYLGTYDGEACCPPMRKGWMMEGRKEGRKEGRPVFITILGHCDDDEHQDRS